MRLNRPIYISLLCSLIWINPATAQIAEPIRFDHLLSYSLPEGLSQNSVYAIEQDEYGFMWFANQIGVDRYDGLTITTYRHQADRPESSITGGRVKALEYALGKLWVGTEEGLSTISFDLRKSDFSVERILSTTAVQHIVATDEEVYWAGPHTIQAQRTDWGFDFGEDITITSIAVLPVSGQLAVGTTNGLYLLNYLEDNPQPERLIDDVRFNETISFLYSVVLSSDLNELYVGIGNNVFKARKKPSGQLLDFPLMYPASEPLTVFTSMLKDRDGNHWLGTRAGGLHILTTSGVKHIQRSANRPFTLNSSLILSLYQSSDGVVWIGTNGGGVNKWTRYKQYFSSAFQEFNPPNGRQGLRSDIWAIYLDERKSRNELFVGTDGYGLGVFHFYSASLMDADEPYRWIRYVDQEDIDRNTVRSILPYRENELIIGTLKGLFKVSVGETEYTEKNRQLPGFAGSVLSLFSQEDKLVVGTRQNGLYILNEGLDSIGHFQLPSAINVILPATEPDQYWIGTDRGLYYFDYCSENSLERIDIGETQARVKSLLIQQDMLWIGTEDIGLLRYSLTDGYVEQLDASHPQLANRIIYGLVPDAQGDLWISTNNGLLELKPEIGFVGSYSVEDGLQHGEFNSGAYAQNRDSLLLFFGGVNGFSYFSPIEVTNDQNSLSLVYEYSYTDSISHVIRGIGLASPDHPIKNNFEVIFDGREVELYFNIFDYHDPENNAVKFRLNKGSENSDYWKYTTDHRIFLEGNATNNDLNIGAGKYAIDLVFLPSYAQDYPIVAEHQITVNVATSEDRDRADTLGKFLWGSGIFAFGALVLAGIFIVFYQRRSLQKFRLEQVHQSINALSRKDKTTEIFQTAVSQLIDEPFALDYAIIHLIDKYENRVIDPIYYSDNPSPFDPPHHHWRNSEVYGQKALALKDNDILEIVFRNRLIIKVKEKQITFVDDIDYSEDIVIDPDLYDLYNHQEVKRVFLPIVRRTEERPGIQEGDFTFGVVETGFHIKNSREIDDELIINLKLYIDNLAQVYYKAYQQENRTRHVEGIVDRHYPVKDHREYLQLVLKDLVETYKCDFGDISIASFSETETGWIPNSDQSVAYKISLDKLMEIRQKNHDKQGIYRYALDSRHYYYSGDVVNDIHYKPGLEDIQSQLSVPLQSFNKYFGVINLYSSKAYFFDDFKAENIQYLADRIADFYLRKKVNFFTDRLIPPMNILLDKERIYDSILKLLEQYFLTKYIGIWEKQSNHNELIFIPKACSKGLQRCAVFAEQKPWPITRPVEILDLQQREEIPYHLFGIVPEAYDFQSLITFLIRAGEDHAQYGFVQIFTRRKIDKLFPEDEIFINQIATKCALSIQTADIFYRFSQMAGTMIDNEADKVYKKITDYASELFTADPVLLFKFSNNRDYQISDVVHSGHIQFPLPTERAKKEPKLPNIVDRIFENGSAYISNEGEYHERFHPDKRNWGSKHFQEDFWHREKICAFAAIRLEYEQKPLGVIFLNYRQDPPSFTKSFKEILNTYAQLAAQTIIYTATLEDNRKFMEKNIRLTKPYLESAIISGMAHNTGNLVMAILRRFNEITKNIEKAPGDMITKKTIENQLELVKAPLRTLNTDYQKLAHFRKKEEFVYFTTIEVDELFSKIVSLIRGKAYQNKVQLEWDKNTHLRFKGDATYIEHAILNLVNNAIDAFRIVKVKGKIQLRATLDKQHSHIIIKIIDNGPGIEEENFKKIFEPYFTTKKDGTGLGLPITKYIIEDMHQGTLEFSSTYRKNTTFALVLPLLSSSKID